METLIEKTGTKKIVEWANDQLWGTGINLNRNDCLMQEKWISPGILGRILEKVRDSKVHNIPRTSADPDVTENATANELTLIDRLHQIIHQNNRDYLA